jgi:hypothetical protein
VDRARLAPWCISFVTNRADRLISTNTLTAEEAHKHLPDERKVLGYRSPPGSLSAEAQSVVDKHDREPVTKGSSRGSRKRSSPYISDGRRN